MQIFFGGMDIFSKFCSFMWGLEMSIQVQIIWGPLLSELAFQFYKEQRPGLQAKMNETWKQSCGSMVKCIFLSETNFVDFNFQPDIPVHKQFAQVAFSASALNILLWKELESDQLFSPHNRFPATIVRLVPVCFCVSFQWDQKALKPQQLFTGNVSATKRSLIER